MNLSAEIDDRQVRAALKRAQQALENPSDLMRTLANQQYRSTVKNFQRESFDGEPWPALQPKTAQAFITGTPGKRASHISARGGRTQARGKRRGHDNMLRPTGKLIFQRLHQRHSKTEAVVACANPWAFVHNFGAYMRQGKMPRRTFLGFSAADLRAIREASEWWVKRSVLP